MDEAASSCPAGAIVVACCQLDIVWGKRAHNEQLTRQAIEAAAADGARLIVLPELANSGYVFESAAEVRSVAETRDAHTVSAWCEEARKLEVVIVGGFCELGDDGALYNSAAVIDTTGLVAVHRKVHLWAKEMLHFSAGASPTLVVPTSVGRLGIAVCYDLEFPEVTRGLALAGADIICAPSNWPASPIPPGERSMLVTLSMATARLNRVFVATCDRAGEERGRITFAGASVITDEGGWLLSGPIPDGAEGTITAACDLSRARDKQINEWNDVLGDRRPNLYST